MPVDKTRRRPRVSPAGSEWSTPRTRLVHRLSPGLSTGVEGWDTPLRKCPHPLPRTGIHLLEHALGLTRATPPPAHRRSCGRRPCPPQVGHAPSRAPEVRTPPRGDNWATRLPALVREVVEAGSSSSTGAHRECPHDTRSPPGRAARSKPLGAIRGGREPQGRRPISAPSGRPLRPGRSTANGIGASSRTGIGSGGGGSLPAQCMRACPRTSLRARSSPRVLRRGRGWAIVTMRRARAVEHAPPRARMGRCDDEARPGRRTCSAAGADGPVAGGPAAQKGGRRVSFTPRPAPLPARSGAMTPFPMSAGAAAHPKVTRRPPFSPRRRPGPRRWGPPEVFTHPGRHRHRPVHDGGRCRSDVPREAARRTEGLIPVRAGPVVRDVAPEVGGGGAPREPRRGAAWSASTSLNPRARTPGRRTRGLPDDLAG